MRSRLRLFALVGAIATVVDVGVLFGLRPSLGLAWADLAALTVAALVAYWLNRLVTFRGAADARWVRSPALFALLASAAGAVDVFVLWALDSAGLALGWSKLAAMFAAASVRWFGYRWVLFNQIRREMGERSRRHQPPGTFRATVVIPAFNEGERVARTVETLRQEFGPGPVESEQVEILVVDDGSADDTAEHAEAAGARVLRLDRNRGKGAAVRAGFIEANGRVIVFTDADLAYPPEAVADVIAELEDGWDMVVGSRRHTDTTTLVRARRLREVGGRGVNWLTHLVLLGRFRDTQCGLKGFRSDIGRVVFERTIIDGFAFDVELFLIAEQDHLSVEELPVSVTNRDDSSVHVVRDSVRLFNDLVRIRRRAGAGGYRPTYHQELILSGTLVEDEPRGRR